MAGRASMHQKRSRRLCMDTPSKRQEIDEPYQRHFTRLRKLAAHKYNLTYQIGKFNECLWLNDVSQALTVLENFAILAFWTLVLELLMQYCGNV